jgi:DNA polymerase III delta prime subunit
MMSDVKRNIVRNRILYDIKLVKEELAEVDDITDIIDDILSIITSIKKQIKPERQKELQDYYFTLIEKLRDLFEKEESLEIFNPEILLPLKKDTYKDFLRFQEHRLFERPY